MKRREFIAVLGSAAAWPVVARAQQSGATRRIGALIAFAKDDPETEERLAAFRQGLGKRGGSRAAISISTIASLLAGATSFRCSRRNWLPCSRT